MAERQIDRIKKAEEAVRELLGVAEQLRREVDKAATENPEQVKELIRAAEKFEREAQHLNDSLRQWRLDIN